MMGNLTCWGIDIFRLSDVTRGRPLTVVAYTILQVISIFRLSIILNHLKLSVIMWLHFECSVT